MNKLNKFLAVFLALHLLLGSVAPVLAEEVSAPPPEESPDIEAPHESDQEESHGSGRNDPENPGEPLGSGRNEPEIQEQTIQSDSGPGTSSDGNNGDTYVDTGDATSEGNIFNIANTNTPADGGCCGGSVEVTNEGNGTDSSNTGSATVTNNNTTNQDNSANIDNGLTGASITGENSASGNTGGESYIDTGNASTTGTIITAANTNVDGVAISEFNIVDDHLGDYILDFNAACIAGCDGFGGLTAQNLNNGANSDNDASLNLDTNNTTDQTNDGTVNNDLYLTSDSGDNTASGNTGGDSYINTGDADVVGNVLTFLNNNLAGNVIFGVVNIFGNLIGDIILPESALNSFACATCGGDTSLINSGNGANSDNDTSSNQTVNNTYNQMNTADINNNLVLGATTGGNSASGNTGGDASITTGNANVLAQVLNIANNNIIGGDWWLVIINRAGQWIGQIVGAPQGTLFAGSEGTEFTVDENGQITASNAAAAATNSGNGANSNNDAAVNSTTNNTTNQTNTADVNNNIYLSANTGKNSTDNNTGGDSYISTGDAEVIANLVNFVNNNIIGGRLLVTFVNVFGNWTGDFITPGNEKQDTESLASTGGNPDSQENTSQGGSNGGSSNAGSSSNNSSNTNNGGLIAVAGAFFSANNSSNGTAGGGTGVQVAGVSVENPFNGPAAVVDSDKAVKINLAWFLLAMPILALAILGKKAYKRGLLQKVL